jgi:hypothetical protein
MVIQFLSFADQSPLPTVTVWNSTYTTSYSTTVAQLGSANSYTATFDASALSGYYWVVVAGTDYEQTFAIKIVDNKIPQYTAGTIDELKQMEGGRYVETSASTAALTLSSGHNAIIASEIESTGGGGAALVLNGGSQSVQSQLIYSSLYDGIIMTAGQHAVDCEFISAGSDAIASEGAGSVTVKAHHIVCDSCCNMESAGIITLTAESISCGASLIEATDSGVINIQSHRISTPNVIVQTSGLQVTIKDAVIGGLLEPVACLAGTLELINCYIRGSLTQSGTGVVRMSNTVVTGTITGTISEYHDLTQQDIRDSMKLAPSAGAAAANSIDDKIDDLAAGGTITHVGPVDPEGVITSPIIIGDDYLATNDRAFIWTIDEVDNFTVATAVSYLGLKKDDDNSIIKQGTVSDNNDGTWDLSIDLTRTDTASLEPGLYEWSVEIRSAGGTEITPVRYGERVRLVAKQT